jgi:hypothetical protein
MGVIRYVEVDFNLVEVPDPGHFFVGYDSNTGKLSQKDSNGIVTILGETSIDPSFNSVTLEKHFTLGPTVNFVHPSSSNIVDNVDAGLEITRGTSGWLFNPLNEGGSGSSTPYGTEWYYINGLLDFSVVADLEYAFLSDAVFASIGSFSVIPNTEWIMHDTLNDKYYYLKFLTWQNGAAGGAFSYDRQLITVVGTGSITFPDGSILDKAPTSVDIITNQKSYVSIDGNDSTAVNYNFNKPYATIKAAVDAANPGDVINVLPGSHSVGDKIYKDGVTVYLEKGVSLYVFSTMIADGNGTFTLRGEGDIFNFVPAFGIPNSSQGYIDAEVGNITAYDALVYSEGTGEIKIKSNNVTQYGSNGVIVLGWTALNFDIVKYVNAGNWACFFIYNNTIFGNHFYNIKIGTLLNSSMQYGAVHFEQSHELCFVNWTGNIEHVATDGGFMNGAITGSSTSGAHGANIKFNGNIYTSQYGIIMGSAGLRMDMVGDITARGNKPAVTICGNNRPTLQLRGNIVGYADDVIRLGKVDVFTQGGDQGFFKHISGSIYQGTAGSNSIILKDGLATECVLAGELTTANTTGYSIFSATAQDIYSLNAKTNRPVSPNTNIVGDLLVVSNIPQIDF